MNLQPITATQIKSVPESEIKYLPGHPRQYRFDASRGLINLNGETNITKKGSTFTFIPIGFRIFRDDILGMGKKKWAEFFFLNQSNHVCNLLVHGYSVEQLMKTIEQMYYDEANLCDVELTLKPVERTNTAAESKYFIADFSYKLLPQESRDLLQTITSELELWREETFTGDAEVSLQMNFFPPINNAVTAEPTANTETDDKAQAEAPQKKEAEAAQA